MPTILPPLILSALLLLVHARACSAAVDNEILSQGSDVMIRHNKDGRKTHDPVVSLFGDEAADEGEMTMTKRLEMPVRKYYVEHEISQKEARVAAEKLDLSQLSSSEEAVGCAPCTEDELAYCDGAALLGDHCCCERRHNEPYAHVPHTCYAGRERCHTAAPDCAQYARLRACCCDKLVAEKYKAIFSAASPRHPSTSWCLLLAASLLMAA